MRAAVLAALAACAAQGAVPQVPLKGTASGNYTTPQEWVIPCSPGLFVSAYVSTPTPLTLGGLAFGGPGGRRVACNSSRQLTLCFRPDPGAEGTAEWVEASWVSDTPTAVPPSSTPAAPTTDAPPTDAPLTPAPRTSAPPFTPAPRTVHQVHNGLIKGNYSTPQEWLISCEAGTLLMALDLSPSGYFPLLLDGSDIRGRYHSLFCPPSGEMSLLFTPSDGKNHTLLIGFHLETTPAPDTRSPDTSAPPTGVPLTPAPPTSAPPPFTSFAPTTVHYMPDRGSVHHSYSTPQEWLISCPPGGFVLVDVHTIPSGYQLWVYGLSLDTGRVRRVSCPDDTGVAPLQYRASSSDSHDVSFTWCPESKTTALVCAPDTHTPVPQTEVPPTVAPATFAPPTDAPDTDAPLTPAPQTYAPPTDLPQTEVPPTPMPPTSAPPTAFFTPAPLTVHQMGASGSVYHNYITPQEWLIPCTPYSTVSWDIRYTPIGYTLELDGTSLSLGSDQHATCPSSGQMSLLYTQHSGGGHDLYLSWSPVLTLAPTPAIVHSMPDHGSVYDRYGTPQEWLISCTPDTTLFITVSFSVSGYNLTIDGTSLYNGDDQRVPCPSSGNMSLLYTPFGGSTHFLSFRWHTLTQTPNTRSPDTPAPPIRVPVHLSDDHGSVEKIYDTPQEWLISCMPYSTLSLDVHLSPGYSLKLYGTSLAFGDHQHVTCPSSGKMSLLYTPFGGIGHFLSFRWHTLTHTPNTRSPDTPAPVLPTPIRVPLVHWSDDHGSVDNSYSTPQEWLISCMPGSTLSFDVRLYPSDAGYSLKLHGTSLAFGEHQRVTCPSSGKVSLLYTPYDGDNHYLSVAWHPATTPVTVGRESQSLSPLLIVLIATAGVLALVGVTVAVYCGCRGKGADPKAFSSNVQYEEYGDVVHTGGFGGLQDSSSPPEGQQPMSEMDEQLLAEDLVPVM